MDVIFFLLCISFDGCTVNCAIRHSSNWVNISMDSQLFTVVGSLKKWHVNCCLVYTLWLSGCVVYSFKHVICQLLYTCIYFESFLFHVGMTSYQYISNYIYIYMLHLMQLMMHVTNYLILNLWYYNTSQVQNRFWHVPFLYSWYRAWLETGNRTI